MTRNIEVVVVGAGVAGAAVAYCLAKEGASPLLVEKDSIASHSSGFNIGMVNPLEGDMPEPLLPLTLMSARMHEDLVHELKDITGIDTSYRRVPYLCVALSEQEAAELQKDLMWQQKTGLSARWLTAAEVKEREPRLTDEAIGALEIGDSVMMDSYRYNLALVEATERLGGRLMQAEVTGLKRNGTGFSVLLSRDREIVAERVVLAMGPWTGLEPSEWLHWRIPVEPLKGQVLRLELEGAPIKCCLAWGESFIMAPKADGLTWAGTTLERVGFDENPTVEGQHSILENLLRVAPGFAEARMVQQTACLRPVSPDILPVVGQVPGWDGVYLATGAGRKGLLLSPIIGRAVCDLILRDRSKVPLEAVSPSRFHA